MRSANPNAKSLFERITTASGEALWRRLLAGGIVAITASAAIELLAPRYFVTVFGAASTIMPAISASVVFGASVYCLAMLLLTWELRYLLSAVAFSTLGAGMALQIFVDLRMPGSLPSEWISTISWTISALFFAVAAYIGISCPASTRVRSLVQFGLSALLVLSPWFLFAPYVISKSSYHLLTDLAYQSIPFAIAGMLARSITIALYAIAFVGFYRRANTGGNRVSGLLCYAFVPLIVGLIYRLGSGTGSNQWSIMSEALSTIAWLALIGGFGIENAIMQREARDRVQELDALHHVSWSIVGAGSVHDLLEMFARTHHEQLGASVAAVYLASQAGDYLELFAICGPDDCPAKVGAKYAVQSANRRPGFHTGHTAKAFLSGEVQIANDVFADVEFVPWRLIAADDGCAVSLPLMIGRKAIGVVNLYFSDCRQLTRQRLRLLGTITQAAAPAIASALAKEAAEKQGTGDVELDMAA